MCIVNDMIAYYIQIISGPYQEIELAKNLDNDNY